MSKALKQITNYLTFFFIQLKMQREAEKLKQQKKVEKVFFCIFNVDQIECSHKSDFLSEKA